MSFFVWIYVGNKCMVGLSEGEIRQNNEPKKLWADIAIGLMTAGNRKARFTIATTPTSKKEEGYGP